ncbi:hypothetical protein HK100_011993 [Physocladia obscura]|uniref:Uncharacterized protein n=1 Tax=Physocladia obscura TaxID=109957 RepID=A0AAD5T1C4_9FUNG|nr:hypothetical protein HK100_011993 [Physocladia obscura]
MINANSNYCINSARGVCKESAAGTVASIATRAAAIAKILAASFVENLKQRPMPVDAASRDISIAIETDAKNTILIRKEDAAGISIAIIVAGKV